MKIVVQFVVVIVVGLISSCTTSVKKTEAFDSGKKLAYCVEKTKASMSMLSFADSLPRNILQGQTAWNKVGIHDWCSGFWPGILWYAYEASGDSAILENARNFTEPLKGVLDVPVDNHDLGFMLYCSFGNGYRLTNDSAYHDFLLVAADSLATLYNPKVGTILSWPAMREKMGWPHNTIIDNMINLELLFWAAKNGGSHDLYDMAVKHAKTCMTTLVRPDYSIYHVAVFDTIDGHFIKGVTHQGYSDSSMWARGQGWGIYGYTMCYRETGKEEFLTMAEKLSDKFLERLPEDGIPYWDFDDPVILNSPKDASSAAVAASGMLELSTYMKDETLKAKYKDAAVALLECLSTNDYLSNDKNEAFLLHSTGHYPDGNEIDASIIYADYYYLEALLRLKKYYQE
ncbi:glycoside hydrolase family 88 protein [Mangrovibacterium lignilyticum]|uniref:glycoside hydrolase family 88 protein n=1 Tax=Mangrovibacterium lignilyticum TaxID=2668052 RepID=UPI0013D7FECD|nr:glycoside hydrolase family 88 protein [Mangrovibacterium lignilyticum]